MSEMEPTQITRLSQAIQEKKWFPLAIKLPIEFEPRVGHALIDISSKNKLLMIGGGSYAGETNEIYEINYSDSESSANSEPPEAEGDHNELVGVELAELGLSFTGRYEFMASIDKSEKKVWIFGGASMTAAKNDVCYIDLEAQKIVRLPETEDAPCGRTQGNNSCLLELNGEEYLVVFGGGDQIENSVADGNLYLYSTSKNTWTKVEVNGSVPHPTQGHGMVSIGTKVYLHGGMDKTEYFGNIYMIDLEPEVKKWVKIEVVTSKPAARAAHGVCLVGKEIFVCGGVGEDEMALSDLWKFNTESNEWTLIDSGLNAFKPRLDMAMTKITLEEENYLLIHGGMQPAQGELAKIHNDFWVYHISKEN